MKFRAEVLVEAVLPTIRARLASELRDRGLTQSEVAEKLGLSQSAVSKYAQGEIETREAVAGDERVQDTVSEIATGLATGDITQVQALVEIEALLQRLSGPGDLVAQLHEEAVPELASVSYDFSGARPDRAALERERVRASVRRGLRLLAHARGFAALVPHVGSNLVECLSNASGPGDVAGVPGRIRDVSGRVEAPGDPEFGVSEYVGGVLLAAREAGSETRAGLNVAFTERTLAILEAAGEQAVELDLESTDLQPAVRAAVRGNPDATVLYHRGAVGLEPIIYLLGPAADDVAHTARAVAREQLEK
ncbi:MAG: thiamine-phosphate synthase family protein [Halodesulfurarchaeum sp.]